MSQMIKTFFAVSLTAAALNTVAATANADPSFSGGHFGGWYGGFGHGGVTGTGSAIGVTAAIIAAATSSPEPGA
jgi:hypothetical protein